MANNNYVYKTGNNLYINLTNKCSNNCVFCIRHNRDGMQQTPLWLTKDANTQDVLTQLGGFDLAQYPEVVFCGFGEPTYNLPTLLQVGQQLRQQGIKVRLNTNGHGSHINGTDIAPSLAKAVDTINISLNAADSKNYQQQCNCIYEQGFDIMLAFATSCKQAGIYTILSVVDSIGQQQIQRCQQLAQQMGLPLRVRQYE